ncbi:MAG: Flp pilus assembly protein CpaB [Candidatus Eisenbacteria bacterium]
MRKGGIVLIVVAFLLAGGAAYLVRNYVESSTMREVPAFETAPVAVSVEDLSYGTKLEPRHLRIVDYPASSVPSGAYGHADSLVGQVTKVFLVTNEPIVATKLSSKGGGLSLRIPEKLRASSVKVDEVSGVSGFILPGDRVDVLVTISKGGMSSDPVTQIVLQDVEVIAAGTRTETEGNKAIDVQQITLLTTPPDAEKLALAQHQGKILLALRNPADRDTLTTYAVKMEDIIRGPEKKSAPAPARRAPPKATPPPPEPEALGKMIIRGGEAKEEEPVMQPEAEKARRGTPSGRSR